MARETTAPFKIGDNTFKITHLAAKEQRRVLRRLMAGIAPLAEGGHEDVGALVRSIVNAVSDDDLDVITDCFAAVTEICTPESAGVFLPLTPDLVDIHFAGAGMSAWLKWMKRSVDHNYSGFFGELRALVNEAVRAGAEDQTQSESQNT